MNPLSISAFFTAITSLTLGGLIFFKQRKDSVALSYSLLTVSFFVWIFGIGMEIQAPNKSWGIFWNRWLYSGAIFIPAFFIHFVQAYLNKIKTLTLMFTYPISAIFLFFNYTSLFVKDVIPKGSFNYASVPGGVFYLFVFYFLSIVLFCFVLMIREFKNAVGMRRNRIKFLLLASVIGFSGGSTNFLLVFEFINLPPVGNYFVALAVFILFYSISKHQDINIVLTKATTYLLMILLVLTPSITLIMLGQKYFFQEINYGFSVIVFSIILLVTICFQRIRSMTERMVEQLLFRNKYDYRRALKEFSKALVTILDLQSLTRRIIETISEAMGVEKASLFLLDEEKGGYVLAESKNVRSVFPATLLAKSDPLPNYLQKIGEIVVGEELMKGVQIPCLAGVVRQMTELEAEVSIPLISKGKLIGMMNLSYKFNREIYSDEDMELLGTLANQATIAIENSRLYEDLKKSKSYIRRTDRLASLGILTAGLAHEIRNPLVAIKTFTQLLPERLEDEEFRNHFLNIAAGEVDRISSLVNELLEFARPSQPKLEMEDVNAVLDGMVLLVSTEAKKKKISMVKQYAPDLAPVQIDREQMKQVFLNILLNAVEATPENGKLCLKTRSFVKPDGESYVQIEFADTGRGIPAEHLEDIFNPFFTTKIKGGGLGLSISNQIVQDHRGYIDVESQVNKGTSFFVNLPLRQDRPNRRRSDLRDEGGEALRSFKGQ